MRGKIINSSPFNGTNATVVANANGNLGAYCALPTSACMNLNGNTPAEVPRLAGSVWTVYRLGGGWEIGGGVRGQTGAWLTDRNDPGSQIPGYLVYDAMIGYVQKQYEVRLNGYNLTDKLYYAGGYNNRPDRVTPGQPASGSVTLTYKF
jgi:catecholate siderophore receptor